MTKVHRYLTTKKQQKQQQKHIDHNKIVLKHHMFAMTTGPLLFSLVSQQTNKPNLRGS